MKRYLLFTRIQTFPVFVMFRDSLLAKQGADLLSQVTVPRNRAYTVCVEGNIGSGKTTLLEYFKAFDKVEALTEPIVKWTNLKGHNALELLYKDPRRWSFSFNSYAQLTRVQMHLKRVDKPVKMLERSLYSTRYCFIENGHRSGLMTDLEYAILTDWFSWLTNHQDIAVDLIVYLRASPEKCYERIQLRDRIEETRVPCKLIEDLHTLHEDWLIHQKYPVPAPVLILNANSEYSEMKEIYELKKQEILCGKVACS